MGHCSPRSLDAAYFFDYEKGFESRVGSNLTHTNRELPNRLFGNCQLKDSNFTFPEDSREPIPLSSFTIFIFLDFVLALFERRSGC